jgi:CelD/BcsL family acetyltransferase involved in cellulose biosynthesis
MYQASIHQGPEALAALSEEWAALEARIARRRFLHTRWWWHSYVAALCRDPASFQLAVVRDNGRAVAMLPLERRSVRRMGWTVCEVGLPEHPHLPLGDILCDPAASGREVIAAVRRALAAEDKWDLLTFRSVLEDSAVARILSHRSRPMSVLSHTCDYLDCARPYEMITAAFSRNFRSNLNKARNKLARESGVEFECAVDMPALGRAFEDLLEVEASGWKGAAGSGTAIKLHPELVEFYRTMMNELAPQGLFLINVMRIGGRAVAAQLCTRDRDTLYILKLAYDEQWARVAPGNMLLEWVIRRADQAPPFRYVNLVNDPPWFKDWCPTSSQVRHLYLFNRTPTGLALMFGLRARQWLKILMWRYDRWQADRGRPRRTQPAGMGSNVASD